MMWAVFVILCFAVAISSLYQRIVKIAVIDVYGRPLINSTSCPGPVLVPKNSTMNYQLTLSAFNNDWYDIVFFLSYSILQIPVGILADRIGGRIIVGLGVLISSIATLLTPIFHDSDVTAIFLAIIKGIGQGALYPGLNVLFANWVPCNKRGVMVGTPCAAYTFGIVGSTIVTIQLVPLIKGWSNSFYFWAMIGMIWYVFLLMYVYSDPNQHRHITAKDLKYMRNSTSKPLRKLKIPWKAIFTDKAVWALVIAEFGFGFSNFTYIVEMSNYFYYILHVDIEQYTTFYMIPYIGQFVLAVVVGGINDYLIYHTKIPIAWVRRFFSIIVWQIPLRIGPSIQEGAAVLAEKEELPVITSMNSMEEMLELHNVQNSEGIKQIPPGIFIPSMLVLIAGYMGCRIETATVLVCISWILKGSTYGGGHKQNSLDLTIHFPGLIMGLVNGIGSISALLQGVGLRALTNEYTIERWQTAYLLVATVAFIATAIYVTNMRCERADWDFSPAENKEKPIQEQETKKKKKTTSTSTRNV